jgi:putative resolvase
MFSFTYTIFGTPIPDDLDRQISYMKEKYKNYRIIKDIGSGLNFKRNGLNEIINLAINDNLEEIVVAYKDRLARFGYDLIEMIIKKYSNGKITILNKSYKSPQEELTTDLVNIMNVFSAKLNGMRKYNKSKQ